MLTESLEMTEHYEKEVSRDELVQICTDMFKEVRGCAEDRRDELYEYFFKKYREVCVAYPIVVKTMCFMTTYSPVVFGKYIDWVKYRTRKTEQDFLEQQAMYMKMLYRSTHKNASQAELSAVYNQALTSLLDEAAEHKAKIETATERHAAKNKKYAAELAADLAKLAREGRLTRPTDIRVVTD
jgi:hypothetical protein